MSSKKESRVVVEKAVVRDGQVVDADSPEVAELVRDKLARAQARDERRREVWGEEGCERIVRLARSFPSLQAADGLDPWDPLAFLDWSLGPQKTSGSWHASLFVLSVWNDGDWSEVAREEGWLRPAPRVHDAGGTARRLGLVDRDASTLAPELVDRAAAAVEHSRMFTFRVSKAFAIWDEAHRAAFLQWCKLPFFP